MKLVSWNVNGLRSCLTKGFSESVAAMDADVICLQETKLSGVVPDGLPGGYEAYFNHAQKKGYSGTAVFARVAPLKVDFGIGADEHDTEGRVINARFPDFWLVNCYTPNSQDGLRRLEYRMRWEEAFRAHILRLEADAPVVVCGDLNVAHEEIDLKNPRTNHLNAGFSDEERAKLTELLAAGYIDSYRFFYPDAVGAYTWWTYIGNARSRNAGWRIDYFLASRALEGRLIKAEIFADVFGSDHCPVGLTLA